MAVHSRRYEGPVGFSGTPEDFDDLLRQDQRARGGRERDQLTVDLPLHDSW